MKISYNWLQEYIDLDLSPEETAEKLTLLGLEVEEFEHTGSDFAGFVAGKVLEVREHPNADKLVLCDVDTGTKKVQIVCGAKNVAAGQTVPVATAGSTLPVPMKDGRYLTIKKTKLRGESSEGMICSEAELGISDDHSGIMVLDGDIPPGTPLNQVLGIEKDTIFEIALTPNRPDAACHIGVARDLSAVTDGELRSPYAEAGPGNGDLSGEISITIEESDKCGRYVGLIVDGVRVDESPAWLKKRLTSIGLRPVNNIVDVTNFVLHEVGQPLHAFDYDRIGGKKIVVKSFGHDQSFVTLDSVERNVPAGSLFICDGNGPVAIAGVMGGENSEVTGNTKKILIESAWFMPSSIRKTAKSLALQTDSSYRFERGVDPELQMKAAKRAAELIADIAGGTILEGTEDVHPVKTEPVSISLRPSRVNQLLGTGFEKSTISSILSRLGFEISDLDEGRLRCTVPTFRPDVTREVDLIEEVGRVYDYNNIPRPKTAPFITPEPLPHSEIFQQRMRTFSKSLGYKEISTNSLLSKKEADLLADESLQIQTLNPVSTENTTLRTHLGGGFLKTVQYNLNRNATNLKFFEIGHVFKQCKREAGTWIEGIEEHIHLLLGLCGRKREDNWQGSARPWTFFDLKADAEALFEELGISGQVTARADGNLTLIYRYKDNVIATLTEPEPELMKGFDIDVEVFTAEIDLTTLFELGAGSEEITYQPVPKYPSFEFDVAFTVDHSVRAGDLDRQIRDTAGNMLHSVTVFDVYEGKNLGKNKKSIAFRLTFLDPNKTLNIKDVEPVVQKIVQKLESVFGAKLRA